MIEDHETTTVCCKYQKKKAEVFKNGYFSISVTLYKKLPTKTRKIENFNAFRKDVFNLCM